MVSEQNTEINQQLLQEAEEYASQALATQLKPGFTYHTIDHTRQVVYACREIGINSGLSSEQIDLLVLAAWFHDLGYIVKYDGHEEESMRIAREFLEARSISASICAQVDKLIEATKMDVLPQELLEKVIKDADLYNLSTPEALSNSDALRHEWTLFRNMELSERKWQKFNLDFFLQHVYYTPYGKSILEERKQKNIKRLKKRLKKLKESEQSNLKNLEQEISKREKQISKLKGKLAKITEQRPDRGVETMFRVVYRTHINLSSIADNKANILISMNAIIISVIFSAITTNTASIEANQALLLPIIVITAVSLMTIIVSILSTRPSVNSKKFTRADISKKKTNLLFFGNFHNMDLDDYLWGIDSMMEDGDYLYGTMAKDIYFLGKVLAKKFQLLRIAYNIFMYGLIIAVLCLIVSLSLQVSS